MPVIIDDNAGFCFGVVKAIAAAEEQLQHCHRLYCLGDIVHNNEEVQRLRRLGLEVIDHQRLATMGLPQDGSHDGNDDANTVLIRAHGEPPETYALAHQRGIRLIDATCPIVLALQKKVREGYEQMCQCGGQVVIFGKPGHAEVIGLNGQTHNSAIIISSPDDIDDIDIHRPIRLYSQTTKSREDYNRLIANIERRISDCSSQQGSLAPAATTDFVAFNTICSRVANRATQLEQFACSVDVLLFVSGVNSSNGHYLFEYCRKVQPNTVMISTTDELNQDLVRQLIADSRRQRIGITGATSTPRWLMEQIKEAVEKTLGARQASTTHLS